MKQNCFFGTVPALICLLAAGLSLISCQTGPANTGGGSAGWHLVFSDSFDRADGFLTDDTNWHVNNNDTTNSTAFINNNRLFIKTGAGVFNQNILRTVFSYEKIRVTLKINILTNVSNCRFALEINNTRATNDIGVLGGDSVWLENGTNITLYTNTFAVEAREIPFNYFTNSSYVIRFSAESTVLTCTVMDTNLNVLTNLSATNPDNVLNTGKIGIHGTFGYYLVDDLMVEGYY